jgi:hypothetical protein
MPMLFLCALRADKLGREDGDYATLSYHSFSDLHADRVKPTDISIQDWPVFTVADDLPRTPSHDACSAIAAAECRSQIW